MPFYVSLHFCTGFFVGSIKRRIDIRKPGQAGGCDLILRMLVALTVKHIYVSLDFCTPAFLYYIGYICALRVISGHSK